MAFHDPLRLDDRKLLPGPAVELDSGLHAESVFHREEPQTVVGQPVERGVVQHTFQLFSSELVVHGSILYEVLVNCECQKWQELKARNFGRRYCFLPGLDVQLNRCGSRERKHFVSFREAFTTVARATHR